MKQLRLDRCAWIALALVLGACGPATDGAAPHGDEHGHEHADEEHEEHGDEVTLTAEALALNDVAVARAELHVLAPTLHAPARVAFNSEGIAHVGIPVLGRVEELRARLGDDVKRGDALLVVQSAELGEAQSELLTRRSATANAGPAVELARSAHERAQALYDRNQGIALTEVQRREAGFRAAQAALAAARAAEDAARARLGLLGMDGASIERLVETETIDPRFTVVAPFDGQVIEREATLGELVGPDREALLVIADMSKLWVVADVPETRLRELRKGARARVLLGSSSDHWCEGVLSFISPALNPATRTVQVRIEPTDRHDELRPGVFARAEIETAAATPEPVLAIPEAATQLVEGRTCVFVPVAGEPGTFALRAVDVGAAIRGLVPVVSGLAAGEELVVSGSFILKAELGKAQAEHTH